MANDKTMVRWNLAYDIAFSLISSGPDGNDVTPSLVRTAILCRLNDLSDDELMESIGAPFDSYEMEDSADTFGFLF